MQWAFWLSLGGGDTVACRRIKTTLLPRRDGPVPRSLNLGWPETALTHDYGRMGAVSISRPWPPASRSFQCFCFESWCGEKPAALITRDRHAVRKPKLVTWKGCMERDSQLARPSGSDQPSPGARPTVSKPACHPISSRHSMGTEPKNPSLPARTQAPDTWSHETCPAIGGHSDPPGWSLLGQRQAILMVLCPSP